jgi:hypothetical protein
MPEIRRYTPWLEDEMRDETDASRTRAFGSRLSDRIIACPIRLSQENLSQLATCSRLAKMKFEILATCKTTRARVSAMTLGRELNEIFLFAV